MLIGFLSEAALHLRDPYGDLGAFPNIDSALDYFAGSKESSCDCESVLVWLRVAELLSLADMEILSVEGIIHFLVDCLRVIFPM